MLRWLREKRDTGRIARGLYGSSVAASRREVFFRELGVPDTIEGRFEMLVLHLFLVLDRLKSEGAERRELARGIADALFESLDDAMREMGVGDLTVPKRMHKAAGAFYGRLAAYEASLGSAEAGAVEAALMRNVYGGEIAAAGAAVRLARYLSHARRALARPEAMSIELGQVHFPEVEEEQA